jgi:hypothetical protein
LAFAVSLNNEAAKVGDKLIDLIRLFLPPCRDVTVEWVSGLQAPQINRRRKASREVNVHTVRAKHVGNSRYLMEIICAEDL